MKKSILLLALVLSIAFTFSYCSSSTTKSTDVESANGKKEVYACPMHPEVTSDKPGDCPKCGMALERKETADSTMKQNQSDTTLKK